MGWNADQKAKAWVVQNKALCVWETASKQGAHAGPESRGGKEYSCGNETKKTKLAILISDKLDFKNEAERQRGPLHDDRKSIESITIINIYAPSMNYNE